MPDDDFSDPAVHGSIRQRLLISLLAGAALLAVMVYFLVLSVARQVAQESQDNILAASANAILDSARYSRGQILVDLPYSALSMLDSVSHERVFYAIKLGEDVLSGYPDLPDPGGDLDRAPTFLSTEYLGEEIRVAAVQRSVATDIGQQVLQVAVAQSLSGQKQTLQWITRASMGVGTGFFLLTALMAWVIASNTIHPIDRLAASVSRRGPKDLRPVAGPVPSEMVPLVISLNSLMNRLQKSLSRSEDFIAEAAHRVRTPLAIVRTKAEIIQRQSADAPIKNTAREMIHAIDDSSRIAGQLLDHAMVTFRLDQLVQERIEMAPLVSDSVERMRPTFDLKDIGLSVTRLDPLTVHGDPILLQSMLRNILDNALKYASPGTDVAVSIVSNAHHSRLVIKDGGPGFPEQDSWHLTDRFARGVNATGVVGSGLGLTIAKEVVEAHGGTMQIKNNTGGGACVTLQFSSR